LTTCKLTFPWELGQHGGGSTGVDLGHMKVKGTFCSQFTWKNFWCPCSGNFPPR
jgi:hypothetical protein